jgi:hypothetical protein
MFLGWIAPGLSRAVDMASPTMCRDPNGGFGKILGECHPHGAAQIRRGIAVRGGERVGGPRFSSHRSFTPPGPLTFTISLR